MSERPYRAEVDGFNRRSFTTFQQAAAWVRAIRRDRGRRVAPAATISYRASKHCWSCRCPDTYVVTQRFAEGPPPEPADPPYPAPSPERLGRSRRVRTSLDAPDAVS